MAVRSDIKASDNWFKAEDKDLEFTIFQDGGVTAQDISGQSFRWTLQQLAERPAVLSLDAQIVDASEGTVTIVVQSLDTRNLPAGTYVHELWRIDEGSTYLATFGDAALQEALLPPEIIPTPDPDLDEGIDGGGTPGGVPW